MNNIIPTDLIAEKIFLIRGKRVMLDRDLSMLYDVETKALKQAVKRNIERFPEDFMFTLSNQEFRDLRSQIVTSSYGGTRYSPMAFTEQGVAMLSSVLRGKRAIEVNIQIMRTFTNLRNMLATHDDLRVKIEAMEGKYDHQLKIVFDAIKQLVSNTEKPTAKIGFTE